MIAVDDGRMVNVLQGSWVRIASVDGRAASNRVYVEPGKRVLALTYGVAKTAYSSSGQSFLRIDCEAGKHYRIRVLALPDGGTYSQMSFAVEERSGSKVAFKHCDQAVDCQRDDPNVAAREEEQQ